MGRPERPGLRAFLRSKRHRRLAVLCVLLVVVGVVLLLSETGYVFDLWDR